jgi:hypothetical protein
MTDDPRDELDRALGARLNAMAPADDDATAVLEEMRPGLRRARTRHRVARASAALGVLAVVVSLVAVVSSGSIRHGKVAVQTSPTTSKPAIAPKPKPPTVHAVTTTTQPTQPVPPITAPNAHSGEGPHPTTPAPANPTPGGGGPTSPGPTSPPQATVLHYSAQGGTLDLTCSDGQLSLVKFTANPGWHGGMHDNSPQEMQVRFTRNSDDGGIADGGSDVRPLEDSQSFIDVRVDGDCAHLRIDHQ